MEAPARTYGSCVGNVGIVGNPEGNRQCLERRSRSGFLCAEAVTAQSSCQRRYAPMVFGIIPECRSASLRKERSASPESPVAHRGFPLSHFNRPCHRRSIDFDIDSDTLIISAPFDKLKGLEYKHLLAAEKQAEMFSYFLAGGRSFNIARPMPMAILMK